MVGYFKAIHVIVGLYVIQLNYDYIVMIVVVFLFSIFWY